MGSKGALLLMAVLGCGAVGCSSAPLVSAPADASSAARDGGISAPFDAGPGSIPDGDVICTLIGCADQVNVNVTVDATLVPAGTHTLSVMGDGTVGSCTFLFPPADQRLGVGTSASCSSGLMLVVWPTQVCTTTQTEYVSSDQCQRVEGKFTESIEVAGTPTTLHVQQGIGGAVISDQNVSLTYQTDQPNGPRCGPICRQAIAAWTIP